MLRKMNLKALHGTLPFNVDGKNYMKSWCCLGIAPPEITRPRMDPQNPQQGTSLRTRVPGGVKCGTWQLQDHAVP